MKQVRIIFLICLIIPSNLGWMQGMTNITRAPKGYSTFQIGGIGSLDMCYRTLENKEREPSIDQLIATENANQMPKFGYHAGLSFCINVSKHFGVETGVIYANRGYETKLQPLFYTNPNPSLPSQGRSIYNINYIDVPLKANFYAGKSKIRFYCSFGVNTTILVSQNETFVKKFEDGRTEYEVVESSMPYEKVVFSGTLAAGLDIKFTKQLNLRLSPNFCHNIGRFLDGPKSSYLWTAGFSADFYFGWY